MRVQGEQEGMLSRIQAFNEAALARHFTKEDFYNDALLSDANYREEVVVEAVKQADKLFPSGVSYSSFYIGRKKSFSVSDLSQKLVFRTCASHLISSLQKRNKSRSQIAREVRVFLLDGTPYNVFRLDIKSFFENIERGELERCIDALNGLPMHSKKLVKEKVRFFREKEGVCVPRGVETSSVLSEIYLSSFDDYVVSREDVFFYSRFVDDLLIITSDEVSEGKFQRDLKRALPEGLSFNKEKGEVKQVGRRGKAGNVHKGKVVGEFDYLGFRFSIIDSVLPLVRKGDKTEESSGTASAKFREVEVDLSPRKVKRIKEKLCKAFYSFSRTGDYGLLKDRIRFLTTNREFVKKDNSTIIPVGVYYNSSACDIPSKQLEHLDGFLRYLLYGSSGRLPRLYASRLSFSQKKELVKFSFAYGFENRVHRKFSFNRLSQIVKVWK